MKNLIKILLVFFSLKIYSQDTKSTVIFQVGEKSKFKERILSNDSTRLFVEYAFDPVDFKIEEFPAKVIGENRSMITIDLPDSILAKAKYIKISSPGKVACTRCPASSDYIELLANSYMPFDFVFNSNPEGADLYLIPLYECKNIFNTNNYDKIKIDESVLPRITSYKISVKPTPLTIKVVSQPYIAIFSIFDTMSNRTKLTKELIRPNQKFPQQNEVKSTIR
ncbi:hypothetical protein [Chryseobacterium lactis]|uniref:hypothetical protein n=1 Tax=Chryseobacterium lactis TaxID=1241981 RepID=UPI00063D4894|nr:hypothetical protein [Chryseobacterium lactis]